MLFFHLFEKKLLDHMFEVIRDQTNT